METRSSQRINIKLKVTCRIHKDFSKKFGLAIGDAFNLIARDISEAGIGVISEYFLPKGLILELEIEGVPATVEKTIKVKGEIRYCLYKKESGYICGIKFLNMLDEDRSKIGEFIAVSEKRKFPRIKLAE